MRFRFFKDDELFSYSHEIEYVDTFTIESQDFYIFKITLQVNDEEKIYYLKV